MPVQRALAAFKSGRLNCAQSILRAFQQQPGIHEGAVQQAQQFGRGRAEGGRCGALHMALQLANNKEVRDNLRKAFAAKAGSEQCREIRKRKALSCEQCVELAATMLTECQHVGSEGRRKCL